MVQTLWKCSGTNQLKSDGARSAACGTAAGRASATTDSVPVENGADQQQAECVQQSYQRHRDDRGQQVKPVRLEIPEQAVQSTHSLRRLRQNAGERSAGQSKLGKIRCNFRFYWICGQQEIIARVVVLRAWAIASLRGSSMIFCLRVIALFRRLGLTGQRAYGVGRFCALR